MPPLRTLNFPVAKKSKRVTQKRKTVKRKTDVDDASSDTSCTENKVPKLKETIDNSSSIEDEMQAIMDVLDNSSVEQFCERKEHIESVREHLDECLEGTKSVSLYIWGSSGTGKTTALQFLMSQKDIQKNFIVAYVDCLQYRVKCAEVYKEIVQKFGGDMKTVKNQKNSVDKMLKIMSSQKKPILLILDEIDVLKTKNQAVLYSLFELPTRLREGQLALITVGNILNFIDRSLPRLRSCFYKKPVTLDFPAYNDKDLVNILAKRLSKVNAKRITIAPSAIELLARKAASVSGDARNALQLAKEVIEICVSKNTKDGFCTIQAPDVFQATTDILGEVEKLKTLDHYPLHQKLMICAVLLLIEDTKFDRRKLNIYAIEDMYRKICKKKNIDGCISTEFIHLFSLIESSGIFSVNDKKITRSSKVTVNWDEDDIRNAFSDKVFFGYILSDNKY